MECVRYFYVSGMSLIVNALMLLISYQFNNLITSTRESSPDNQNGDRYTKKTIKGICNNVSRVRTTDP